jgi:hypothetical protein
LLWISREGLRSEDRNEKQYGLGIRKSYNCLLLHERFVLYTSFIASNTLYGNEALTLVQETAI